MTIIVDFLLSTTVVFNIFLQKFQSPEIMENRRYPLYSTPSTNTPLPKFKYIINCTVSYIFTTVFFCIRWISFSSWLDNYLGGRVSNIDLASLNIILVSYYFFFPSVMFFKTWWVLNLSQIRYSSFKIQFSRCLTFDFRMHTYCLGNNVYHCIVVMVTNFY